MSSFRARWDDLPEREVLTNNFRTAMTGKETGVNRIRWIHPTVVPTHSHPDCEQTVIVTKGRVIFTVEDDEFTLEPGEIAILPRNVPHGGRSIEGEAEFIEIFAPTRIENLVGFVGSSSMPDPDEGTGA
ncbi:MULTISPECIES: cupin domain-containing protein [unclassified Dietzia]|uniref:cupin domain-containing protein n=1 Tax=unclassified Dietzia TaxID=2617939 RepID=UPI00131648FF|nr:MULTISPECIES: cupin domain-containing protein [unclassified Dietzia]MBB1022880.1 cupin domain-containing protein [Dietzia sp. DQ12-76]MBB1026247.1 cupin domain-containing protein [Dietzia sp. DQ11-38-2]QGW24490.1 cupin 2 barrel domain-containing protein [Dietzia sp. DQ12-45-1b]